MCQSVAQSLPMICVLPCFLRLFSDKLPQLEVETDWFWLDRKKKLLTLRAVRHWDRLPGRLYSPTLCGFLGVFKTCLGRSLRSPVWAYRWPCFQQEIGPGPFSELLASLNKCVIFLYFPCARGEKNSQPWVLFMKKIRVKEGTPKSWQDTVICLCVWGA